MTLLVRNALAAARAPAAVAAAAAALVAPVYLMTGRWRRLLVASASSRAPTAPTAAAAATAAVDDSLHDAIRISVGITRRLARIPLSPWRSTCLYRAVAVCIMLRWSGIDAVLRIGVQRGQPHHDDADLTAHAWVENAEGDVVYEQPGDYVPLGGTR